MSVVKIAIGSVFVAAALFFSVLTRDFRRLPGDIVMAIGVVANAVAVISNGGAMPVFTKRPDKFTCRCHVVGNDSHKYRWLCDIYDSRYFTFSVGDLFLVGGFLLNQAISAFFKA